MPKVYLMNSLQENERQPAYSTLANLWSSVDPTKLGKMQSWYSGYQDPYDAWKTLLSGGLPSAGGGANRNDPYLAQGLTIGPGGTWGELPADLKGLDFAYRPDTAYNEGTLGWSPTGSYSYDWDMAPLIAGQPELGASFIPLSYIERNAGHYREIDPNFDVNKLQTTNHPIFGKVALPQDLPQLDQTSGEEFGEMLKAAGTIAGIASGFGNALGYLQPGSGFSFMGDLFNSFGFDGGGGFLSNIFGGGGGGGWEPGSGGLDWSGAEGFGGEGFGGGSWGGWDGGGGLDWSGAEGFGGQGGDFFGNDWGTFEGTENLGDFGDWFQGMKDFQSAPVPQTPNVDLGAALPEPGSAPSGDMWNWDVGGTNQAGIQSAAPSIDTGGSTMMNTAEPGWTSPTQVSASVTPAGGSSIMDTISNKVKNMGLQDIMKLGQGIYAGYSNNQRANDMRKLMESAMSRSDPFGPQRPQYQGMLSDLFTTGGRNRALNEWMSGTGGMMSQGLQRRDAAQGRRNAGAASRTAAMQSGFLQDLERQKAQLANLAGAQFGPGNVGNIAAQMGPRTSSAGSWMPIAGALGSIFGGSSGGQGGGNILESLMSLFG